MLWTRTRARTPPETASVGYRPSGCAQESRDPSRLGGPSAGNHGPPWRRRWQRLGRARASSSPRAAHKAPPANALTWHGTFLPSSLG